MLRPPAEDLVHALKYGGWPSVAEEMARLLLPCLPTIPPQGSPPILIPIPTTRERLRQRGYNQAEVLAAALAREGGGVMLPLLRRIRGENSQIALHREERLANVRGAFLAQDDARARALNHGFEEGSPLVLVDDVRTTGATALAATEALESVGLFPVHLVTFALAPPAREEDPSAFFPIDPTLLPVLRP